MNIVSREILLEELSFVRRKVIALIEGVFGSTAQWPYVRSQLLTLLGERGLEGAITRAFQGTGNGYATKSEQTDE